MHILHIIDSLNLGGAERAAVDLANMSKSAGLQVSFCMTRQQGSLESELLPSVNRICLNRTKKFDRAANKALLDYIETASVDIIHAHMRSTTALMTLLKTIYRIRAPILFHDHFGGIEIDKSVPIWLSLWGHKLIDQYVGVYPKHSDWALKAGFPSDRIKHISYSLDLQRISSSNAAVDIRNSFGIPADRPIGIVVGNLRFEKGTDELIRAIANSSIAQQAVYLLVGREADPEFAALCQELCKSHQLQQTIYFAGSRTDVPALLNSVDFAIMPSRSESGPLVLIEYMMANLPFVSFNVGDIANQIAALGVEGFVVPGNYVGLIRNIEMLVHLNAQDREKRGAIGRNIAEMHFNIISKKDMWIELYNRLSAKS